MATIVFNSSNFRAMFPAYADPAYFTTDFLRLMWDNAVSFVSDQSGGCYILQMTEAQQTLALNYMTAHLVYISRIAETGQNTGVMTSATIDKISVAVMPPPATNNWRYWLNQSPYGQQLLSLLEIASVGGGYYGGYPVIGAFVR